MTRDEILQQITHRFSEEIIGKYEKSDKRVYFDISAAAIVPMAQFIFKDLGARFNIASAVDGREQMEILYHFTAEDADLVLSLRVILPKSNLEVDSLTPVFTAAHWIEREIHELFGINFKGHPKLERLLLPEDWPEGVHPLRKDYKEWDPGAIRDRGA